MDRLFLQGITDEIRSSVVGRKVRSAVVDREQGLLSLGLGSGRALQWSFLPEVAGPFLAVPLRSGVTTPGLKTRIVSASIVGLESDELDRIVTLRVDQTRLSGKRAASRLVLEVLSRRVALYLVDEESGTIVEAFARSSTRQRAGERYESPPPPPSAGPIPADRASFEARLREALARGLPRRSALLASSGLTPLLVREMEWLVDEEKRTESEAFDVVRARLAAKTPVVYEAGDEAFTRTLSPMELASERSVELRTFRSFSDALADSVERWQRHQRVRSLRARLSAALARRLEKTRKLRRRLGDDLVSREDPGELRLRGEKLLAGMSRGRRTKEGGNVVVVPDSFDPEEREIEIEIDPRLTLAANAERWFARARKAERAREELERRIEALDAGLSYWETLECDLRDADTREELEALEREAREEGLVPAAPTKPTSKTKKAREAPGERMGPRRYVSRRGNVILVGRSGRSNDETTFRIARPDDLWFHAAGIPGAHVVLRLSPGALPDEGELEDAASLAAYFSKGREDTRVDVFVTERRNVSKIKGAPPGLVKVQNVRTLRVMPRGPGEETSEAQTQRHGGEKAQG